MLLDDAKVLVAIAENDIGEGKKYKTQDAAATALGISYYTFKSRYALTRKILAHGRQVEIVVGYINLQELSDKIQPFSKRILKEDCLDLPKKTYIKHRIELTAEQKKVYNQMKKEAIAF